MKIKLPILIIDEEDLEKGLRWTKRLLGFDRRLKKEIKIVKEFKEHPDQLLFIYGSLLVPESFRRTIDFKRRYIKYMPAELEGYVLEWNAPHKKINMITIENGTWISQDYKEKWLSLTLKKSTSHKDKVKGALVAVNNKMLRQLEYRESSYTLIKIGRENIHPLFNSKISDRCVIYTFIWDKHCLDKENKYRIRKEYFDSMIKARSVLKIGKAIPKLEKGVHIKTDAMMCDYEAEKRWKKIKLNISDLADELYTFLKDEDVTRYVPNDYYPIPSSLRPYMVNKFFYRQICTLAEYAVKYHYKAYKICIKNKNMRKESGLSEIDLKLSDQNLFNNRGIPKVTRVDLVKRGNNLKVFEVNADSPGGMFHYDYLFRWQIKQLSNFSIPVGFGEHHNLSNALVDVIKKSWEDYSEKKAISKDALQYIVILEKNPKHQPTYKEFLYFEKLLSQKGMFVSGKKIKIEILEPSDLKYNPAQKGLYDHRGNKVDLIYKRILWKDLLEFENPQEIYNAYLDDNICIVNSLDSRHTGNKYFTAMLYSDKFVDNVLKKELTEEEFKELEYLRTYIPATYCWKEGSCIGIPNEKKQDIFDSPSNYVIKSYHGHGSKEVYIDFDANELEYYLKKKYYVVQEKIPHGLATFPVLDEVNKGLFLHSNFIIGAYVINGKCVAIESKLGNEIPISINKKGCYRTTVLPIEKLD